MSKKFDAAGAMFNKPHFAASDDVSGGNPPDPVVPSRIKVTLDKLEPYAGNPRTKRNPNYDEIKESIKYRGLDHAPNVTRPTPDQPYMINDGGNTRLQILKELWEETGERRFFEIDCMFRPWKSERDVLVAHIIENEMRGRMNFIDRARAAVRLKVDLEREQQTDLPINELAKQITELGWSLKQPNLSAMIYAHSHLLPFIPETLDAGMGRPSILGIKKMLDDCRTYWDSVAIPDDGSFESIWQPIFEEMDSYGAFDLEIARDKIEEGIAARLQCPVSAIRSEIQGVARGHLDAGHRPVDLFKPNGQPELAQADNQPSPEPAPTLELPREEAKDPSLDSSLPEAGRSSAHSYQHEEAVDNFGSSEFGEPTYVGDSRAQIAESVSSNPSEASRPRAPKEYTLDEAKRCAYEAAKQLADLCGFGRGILSAREAGITTPEPYLVHVGSLHDVPRHFQAAALDIFGLILETTAFVASHIHCPTASADPNNPSQILYQQYLNHDHVDMHQIRLTVAIHKTHPGSLPGMDLRGGSTEHWAAIMDAIDHFYWAMGLFLHAYCLEHPEIEHNDRGRFSAAGQ